MIILDTNVVSEAMRRPAGPRVVLWLDRQVEGMVWITAVTVLEVRTGIEILPSGRRRAALSVDFERFLDTDIDNRVLAFDSEAAHATASITAARRRLGRTSELRDSMIAGIAFASGAALATRKTRHFDDLSIALIDPWLA